MSIQITTETTHDAINIHLNYEDIEIGTNYLKHLNTIVLNFGDLHIFLSQEQAETLHEAIGESLLSSKLESLVK